MTTFKRHIAVVVEDSTGPPSTIIPCLPCSPSFNWDRALGSVSLLSSYLGHNRETPPRQLVCVLLDLLLDTGLCGIYLISESSLANLDNLMHFMLCEWTWMSI